MTPQIKKILARSSRERKGPAAKRWEGEGAANTYAFDYFAKNYQAEQQAESGSDGTFYCHPSGSAGTNGFIVTQSLGEMWAEAMANNLYRNVPSPYAFS